MADFLTTKQVAQLLCIKERKLYELAKEGSVLASRVSGKLLFFRELVEGSLTGYYLGTAFGKKSCFPCNLYLAIAR